MFIKDGLKTVLMLVKPNFMGDYKDEWRVEIPEPKIGIKLVTFDGKKGNVVRSQYISDYMLYWNSKIISSLFWVEDLVDDELDPAYYLEINNVFFYVEDDNPNTPYYNWVKSTVPSFGYVRFETNHINLLKMIEDNVSWKSIEDKYVAPRDNQLVGLVGSSILSNLIDTGVGFLMRVLFKI